MKRFAIFIGIDAYSNGITKLQCACNDASDLALKFAAAGFDKIELVKENEAESSRLLGKIDNFCKNIRSGDLLVFYFAGNNMNSSGTQNICRNGNIDDWDEVKLFTSSKAALFVGVLLGVVGIVLFILFLHGMLVNGWLG